MIDLLRHDGGEARDELSDMDLGLTVKGTASSDDYPEGQIMEQDVDEGEMVDKNTTIEVIVSSGPGEMDIPNVVGQDEDTAISALQNAGFSYSRNYEYSTDVARGKVISQNPTGQGKEGDTITIVVSQGVPTTTVPNGIDQRYPGRCYQQAAGSGLNVGSVTTEHSSSVAEGNVIRMSVSAGTTVDQGTRVDLVISSGPETVYYSYSRNLSMDLNYDVPVYVVLKDANEKELWSGTWDPDANRNLTISASNITTSSGTLYYTPEGGTEQSKAVTFTRQ